MDFPIRINKYIAHKGYCTRTEADTLIERGSVLINGRKAVLGEKVHEHDTIEVHTKERAYRYFAFNKPQGVVTHSPQFGEKDAVGASKLWGTFPIGRLDKDSHGLIILTDDARVTDRLLNPKYEHEKQYRVTLQQTAPDTFRERMEKGVNIEGYLTKPCTVRTLSPKKFEIILTEGKKHQIRRMCAALNTAVADLERIRIMNIELRDLKEGEYQAITGATLTQFLKSLGL
ncbi:rRNA pseudouridine synthase [bacterium]|nr:rRNA pseudouridine synthase [bacterium]